MRAMLVVLALLTAGCAVPGADVEPAATEAPVDYQVPEPDASLALLEEQYLIPMPVGTNVEIHARIVRPDVDGPVPVVVEFTPYTAPGRAMLIEPAILPPLDVFVDEFVRRGFAFAYADVRGTGDSSGCMDLRGQLDIEDAYALTEWLGTQEWSNGKVGFIGASYPGSEAHIAAIANNPHLGGVIPVVASTSFYHYHHMAGVPYLNHLTTNSAYTAFASAPTLNPQLSNWATRQVTEVAECDQATHLTVQLDQSGTYDAWWADRNLRGRAGEVGVPVLMAQGLADWNVKPDHIARYWNDLGVRKTLIGGQWGHQYPEDADEAYGDWWEFATAFFDETLRGTRTGLFDADRAYIQDNAGDWREYASWPPLDATWLALPLEGRLVWDADPASGPPALFTGDVPEDEQVVVELAPLGKDTLVSGAPRVNLTIVSSAENVHLVAILEVADGDGWVRENHGYLNPIYRDGIDAPARLVPGEPTPVTIEMYPQEDLVPAGAKMRLVLRSVDDNTVPAFDRATIEVLADGERAPELLLPVSPLA